MVRVLYSGIRKKKFFNVKMRDPTTFSLLCDVSGIYDNTCTRRVLLVLNQITFHLKCWKVLAL